MTGSTSDRANDLTSEMMTTILPSLSSAVSSMDFNTIEQESQTVMAASLKALVTEEEGEGATVDDFLDDRAFIDQDPAHAFPYLTAVILSLVVGTFGNLMIIGAHLKYKKLRKTGSILVINLALADLCVTSFADPMCILGTLKGKRFFDSVPWLCELIASLCLTACFCAFFNLSCITLNRFLFVCHNGYCQRVFTRKKTIGLCVFVWVAAFCFEMPNFVGWGDHYFDQKNHQCIWNRQASRSYSLFVAVALIMVPLVSMLLAYGIIFLKIFRTKKEIHKFDEKKAQEKRLLKKEWIETFHACRTMCCIVVAFVVCWTPYAVVITVDFADRLPTWVHLWVTFLAHFHSVVNFFIYLGNKEYNEAFSEMLCCPKNVSGSGSITFTSTTNVLTKFHRPETSSSDSRF